jgi:hydroxyacylglutathione hydrolase
MCGHGERAMTAATLLQRGGARHVSVMQGGAHDWAKATGNQLQHGA